MALFYFIDIGIVCGILFPSTKTKTVQISGVTPLKLVQEFTVMLGASKYSL
jgi:hypothetical protein